jgi:hypothetical protein
MSETWLTFGPTHSAVRIVLKAQISHRISQSDWIGLLEEASFRRVLLLELDVPDPQAQSLASLVGKKADDEEQGTDVQDASRAVRKESRETHLGYEPRLELVRQAAKFLCDLGAHPEVTETRRHHAYGALVMVDGLLHMCAKSNL